MANVRGVPCSLAGPAARRVLAAVLDQVRARNPADHATLCRVVTDVRPLPVEEVEGGTLGRWQVCDPEPYSAEWGYGDDASPGVAFLDQSLPPGTLSWVAAHEFGHACTTAGDFRYARSPDGEWASEVAADRYAYRWGFGRAIGRARKSRHLAHHGPAPGREFTMEMAPGEVTTFRLTRRFRFVLVPALNRGKKT